MKKDQKKNPSWILRKKERKKERYQVYSERKKDRKKETTIFRI